MTTAIENPPASFVIVPLGSKKIALQADSVIELVAPVNCQTFPHRTRWISGVIVRRNRVVPVCDVGQLFGEKRTSESRFYLIAEWNAGRMRDWCAIPVCGECELASANIEPGLANSEFDGESFLLGSIRLEREQIEVVNLTKLIQARQCVSSQRDSEGVR